ncbi:DUF397 domain-containing protein [Saccharopolyspora sp. NPDC050389]
MPLTSNRSGDQVPVGVDRAVAVRDSKAPEGGHIVVSHAAWRAFLRDLR